MPADRPRDAAVVGPHVVVSLRAAAAWAPALRRQVRKAADDGVAVHPFVLDVAEAFSDAAAFVSESERAKAGSGSSSLGSGDLLSVAQVAKHVGLTDQAVRLAARDGRLLGRRSGRSWIFDRRDVERWVSERAQ